MWIKIKDFLSKLWGAVKLWAKNVRWADFLANTDLAYLYPFCVFFIALVLVKGNWLWDLVVLALYSPILFFGYLKNHED